MPRDDRSRPAQAAPEVTTTTTSVTAGSDITEAVELQEMTQADLEVRDHCEAVVDRGLRTFVEVGIALATIRERRLYRDTHDTFVAYVADRFDFGGSTAYRKIDAAKVAEAVSPIGEIANEAQARKLVPLLGNPDQLRAVFAKETSSSGPTTAARFEVAVRAAAPKPKRKRPPKAARSTVQQGAVPPIYLTSQVRSSVSSCLEWLKHNNGEVRFANDINDAEYASDQKWLDESAALVAAMTQYVERLRKCLTDPAYRREAMDSPAHRDDLTMSRPRRPRPRLDQRTARDDDDDLEPWAQKNNYYPTDDEIAARSPKFAAAQFTARLSSAFNRGPKALQFPPERIAEIPGLYEGMKPIFDAHRRWLDEIDKLAREKSKIRRVK